MSTRPSHLSMLAMAFSLISLGCADFGGEEPRRGGLGKADLIGSCEASTCGGVSAEGNCFCDDECSEWGDCCADKVDVCGSPEIVYTTYNAGLLPAVGLDRERQQPIIEALGGDPAGVVCLQEVWTDTDAAAIADALAEKYPHSFREVTESTETQAFACKPWQVPAMLSLNSCVKDNCTSQGVSMFECIENQCASEYDRLDDKCQLCLGANSDSPARCAYWGAAVYGNGGRNGLMLLSAKPLDDVSYTEFDTQLIKRGVITAQIDGTTVQCTHMSADLGRVPYPQDEAFASWGEEHFAQVEKMAELAGDTCTVLMGDLNTGPEGEFTDGELADNYQAMLDMGFDDQWDGDAPCTHCSTNPLVGGSHSSRIDHVMVRNCGDTSIEYARVYDQLIEVTDSEGREHTTALSDHYGVTAYVSH